jgi:hypothetical protein
VSGVVSNRTVWCLAYLCDDCYFPDFPFYDVIHIRLDINGNRCLAAGPLVLSTDLCLEWKLPPYNVSVASSQQLYLKLSMVKSYVLSQSCILYTALSSSRCLTLAQQCVTHRASHSVHAQSPSCLARVAYEQATYCCGRTLDVELLCPSPR